MKFRQSTVVKIRETIQSKNSTTEVVNYELLLWRLFVSLWHCNVVSGVLSTFLNETDDYTSLSSSLY